MGSSWTAKFVDHLPRPEISRLRHLAQSVHHAAAAVLNLIFPARCSFCRVDLAGGHAPPFACESCEDELVERGVVRCRRCGAVGADADEAACTDCRRTKLWFDRVVTLGTYEGPLRTAVLHTKSARQDMLAVTLTSLLVAQHRSLFEDAQADVIVPVPMHWWRWLWRGTNGAAIIAQRLADELGLPVARDALARRRHTQLQSGLLRTQRFENVRGAFRSTERYHFRGANVLLVDDILTTGATASEAAHTLKRAGAGNVVAVVLARTSGLD